MKTLPLLSFLTVIGTAATIVVLGVPAAAVVEASTNAPTGTVTGVVTDATTGQPLANDCSLTIHLRYAEDFDQGDGLDYDVRSFTGCLDSQGGYTITGVPTDEYAIHITDSSNTYYSQWLGTTAPNSPYKDGLLEFDATNGASTTQNIALDEAGSITGTMVSAATGDPIANDCNLNIGIFGSDHDNYGFDNTVCTAADGSYTIAGVDPEYYTVIAGGVGPGDGYLEQRSASEATVNAGAATTSPTLALTQAAIVRVIFRSAAKGHRLLAGFKHAEAGLETSSKSGNVGGSVSATTGKHGAITIRDGKAGSYIPRAHCYDDSGNRHFGQSRLFKPSGRVKLVAGEHLTLTTYLGSKRLAVGSTIRSKPKKAKTVPVGKPATISGTVTDATTGLPLAGYCNLDIDLVFEQTYASNSGVTPVSVKTWHGCLDSTGGYTISGVVTTKTGSADYTLYFSDFSTGYSSAYLEHAVGIRAAPKFPVGAGQAVTGQDIALDEDATVSGTLYDIDGDPIANTCGIKIAVGNVTQPDVCTDADGGYSVAGIYAPQTVGATITVPGFHEHTVPAGNVAVSSGELATGIDAYLVATRTPAGPVAVTTNNDPVLRLTKTPKPSPYVLTTEPVEVEGNITDYVNGEQLAFYCGITVDVVQAITSKSGAVTSRLVKRWQGCLNDGGGYDIANVPRPRKGTAQYTTYFFDNDGSFNSAWSDHASDIKTAPKVAVEADGPFVYDQETIALEPETS